MIVEERTPRVEVLWLALERMENQVEAALAVLSDDERGQAERYRFDSDRIRYVLVRAALRHELGRRLDCAPSAIRFSCNEAGKPLLDRADELGMSFNVSHSGSRGLLAFGFGCCVGCDVEWMKPDIEFHALARHSFSPGERRQLAALPANDVMPAFYRCWTRKEAYIKALGYGVGYGLDRFDVSLRAAETRVLADRNDDGALTWRFTELALGVDYAAVVVADALDYALAIDTAGMT
jgi:4'-phosphopantetheinyl transferase